MLYPAIGWFEIVQYNDKPAATIENLVDQTWLCRHPRPTIITYYCGNEFPGYTLKNNLIKTEYRIKSKCATMENQ